MSRQANTVTDSAGRDFPAGRRGRRDPCVGPRALAVEAWRLLMETARCAGRRMANRGEILVRQGGRTIDPQDFKGPVLFARGPRLDGGVGA